MGDRRNFQAVVGALVLLAVVAVGVLSSMHDPANNGYRVHATFDEVSGLSVGSPVWLGGLPVGEVVAMELGDSLRARVTLRIEGDVALPTDTAAAIKTQGILGDKHVALQPGAAFDSIEPGGTIAYTQDALIVEELLQLVVSRARARKGAGAGEDDNGQPKD